MGMHFIRPLGVAAVLLLTGASFAQTAKTETVRPLAKIEKVAAVKLDTKSFKKQINETFQEHEREVENPMWPEWIFKVHPKNNLPVGKANLPSTTQIGKHFPAIDATGWVPADPNLAVGTNHVVVVVNCSVAWLKRDGTKQFQQTFQDFFAGTGAGSFIFDPKAFYDRTSGRYIFCALEQSDSPRTSKLLVAVSDDGDPNGTWYRYRFDTRVQGNGVDAWLDYPGFGYNKDAIVGTGNLFGFDSGFYGVLFMTVAKAPLLKGETATARYMQDTNAATAQMSQIWSPTEDRLFGVSRQDTATAKVFSILNPASSTPTLKSTYVSFPNFDWPSNYAASNPGFLDILDTRFFNCNYRDGRLTTAHAVRSGATQNKVRWYEFNLNSWPTTGAPTLRQSGEVAPNDATSHFHMPAIAQNAAGDITTLFTRSSTTAPADLVVSSRKATDPLGAMGFPILLQGSESASYGGAGVNRWGDYFDVNVDPLDDTTFWGVGMLGNPSGGWRTHVFSWTSQVAIPLEAMTGTPTTLLGGVDKLSLTMTLLNAAPKGGVTVSVNSTESLVYSTPAPSFSQKEWRKTFSVSTAPVTTTKTVLVSANTPGTPAKTVQVTLKPRRIDITAKLTGLLSSHAGRSISVAIRTVGTTVALDNYALALNAKAYAGIYTDRTGSFDVAISAPGFLRKVTKITVPVSGAVPIVNGLICGDADRDNDIDEADLSLVRSLLNQVGTNGDLDGDGRVTTKDIAIVQKNLGKKGDA